MKLATTLSALGLCAAVLVISAVPSMAQTKKHRKAYVHHVAVKHRYHKHRHAVKMALRHHK